MLYIARGRGADRHRALAIALDDAAPVVNSLKQLGIDDRSRIRLHWMRLAVLFGAMMGMISSLLVFQLGQARVWFSMSRDGLLPKLFGRVHPRFRTPSIATWIAGFWWAFPAGILDIGTLADLSNIGTLFAFVLVSIGVIILRYNSPSAAAAFARRVESQPRFSAFCSASC